MTSHNTLPICTVNSPTQFPSLEFFGPLRHEPDFSTPAVGELSAGLGLPDIKRRNTTNDSSAQSQKSRGYDGNALAGLDGKLIGRALNKPMTANYLAQYLNGLVVHQAGLDTLPQGIQYDYITPLQESESRDGQATTIVQPPPGFGGVQSRKIRADESSAAAVSAMEPLHTPTGPAALSHPRRFSDLPQYPQHHGHTRHASGGGHRRRSRAYTRGKRTDQGPEPSVADIYPEDANYTPRRPSHRLDPAVPFHFLKSSPPPQPQFHVEDPVSWPTPAEMYALKPQKPQTPRSLVQLFEQQFANQAHAAAPAAPLDIFEDHSYPSKVDFDSADDDVTVLLSSIPNLFYQEDEDQIQAQEQDTIVLSCDTRSLTPQQLSGVRYGLRYFGISLQDIWKCPEAKEGEPFRVRPRNHEGWGSWEWAIRNGWGQESVSVANQRGFCVKT